MALTINTNVASLFAQNALRKNSTTLNKSFARLSSGLRINSAADDASGLAVSSRLTAQIVSMNAAARNANDGISLLQVADAALAETVNALQRIRELAVQSNTTTISTSDQDDLQLEVTELMEEIQRISSKTDYNNTNLLDNTFNNKPFQIGPGPAETVSLTIATSRASSLGLSTGATVNGMSIGAGAGAITGTNAGYIGSMISRVDNALDSVASIRANLGAHQSRFESVTSNMTSAATVTTAARARILDANIADETANMAKYSILQQASVAVMAQANQQSALAARLLLGIGG